MAVPSRAEQYLKTPICQYLVWQDTYKQAFSQAARRPVKINQFSKIAITFEPIMLF